MLDALEHLGYPRYFAAILGTWKVLGALAILVPGRARLKEWAYAGMCFDLTAAALSHAAVGDGAAALAPPLLVLGLALASWRLRPPSRTVTVAVDGARSTAALPASQPDSGPGDAPGGTEVPRRGRLRRLSAAGDLCVCGLHFWRIDYR